MTHVKAFVRLVKFGTLWCPGPCS